MRQKTPFFHTFKKVWIWSGPPLPAWKKSTLIFFKASLTIIIMIWWELIFFYSKPLSPTWAKRKYTYYLLNLVNKPSKNIFIKMILKFPLPFGPSSYSLAPRLPTWSGTGAGTRVLLHIYNWQSVPMSSPNRSSQSQSDGPVDNMSHYETLSNHRVETRTSLLRLP